jgi:hypothetical protein
MSGVATMHDVEAIEARGAPELPPSTYELKGAAVTEAELLDFLRTSRGMAAQLRLDGAASRDVAQQVLGRFTVPFTIV